MHKNLLETVSFGTNVRQPHRLHAVTMCSVLNGIRDGGINDLDWSKRVDLIRKLPFDSKSQKDAKLSLPFFTPAGTFRVGRNDALLRHAGQICMDLDDLNPDQSRAVMNTALDDEHCLAAFRSVRLRGVHLILKVPQCSSEQHSKIVFPHAARYVRDTYGYEVDFKCRNVCRASFVSYDTRILVYPRATPLEIDLSAPAWQEPQLAPARRCPVVAGPSLPAQAPTKLNFGHVGAFHLGTCCGPHRFKPDGTHYTHQSLFQLGKRIAMLVCKQALSKADTSRLINEAFAGWIAEARRSKHPLRGEDSEYRQELGKIVRSSVKRKGIARAVATWTQWTRHAEFPSDGDPEKRLLFAIRNHCEARRTKVFFIGCRDAAVIAGVRSTKTSAKLLRDLRRRKILSRSLDGICVPPRPKRHAQRYRFLG